MRKVELIYLHALLAKVHDYLSARHDLPETFEGYETSDVGPYQIQCRKAEHEAAARLLAERLAEEVETDDLEAPGDEREVEAPEA